jgi:non-specific protein-tyrosine kinase
MAVTEAATLSPSVDGVLLVVKPGSTTLAACRQVFKQLQRVEANILGVVTNNVDINHTSYKYVYYRGYRQRKWYNVMKRGGGIPPWQEFIASYSG